MASDSSKHEDGGSPSDQVEKLQVPSGSSQERMKTIRHPRWTRKETLTLIEGKKVIENGIQFQKGRRSTAALGPDPVEPKWDLVSSFCKQRGVSRGPVQCRKRWSNLLVDFKKIRNWESQIKGEAESFWVMRNDLRRDKKLPGFFDRDVYNVLDGKDATAKPASPLAVLCPMPLNSIPMEDVCHVTEEAAAEEEEEEVEEEEPEKFFNSIRNDSTENDLFSDFEESGQEETTINSKKEQKVTGSPTKIFTTPVPTPGPVKGKRGLGSDTGREEKQKQRRLSRDGCEDNCSDQLIRVLEKNSKMMNAQLEAHNKNYQLDREKNKEQNNNLLAAIKNVTDALVRIADKLTSHSGD
ncbi:putative transcription factor MYB-HB-like family [Rosa chinensis]|uniref:Putative transcription factor MYB-HB-like family n=1 Tax=Rosa chinensis TaxID=74649 RepID=A0A2P6P4M1_ROSCH|nr:trihelix transcription factor ASR3 [Rosa chinensis]PRQ16856.1 putative transcription factor MYB-HB-like family [Rosa chinensis]